MRLMLVLGVSLLAFACGNSAEPSSPKTTASASPPTSTSEPPPPSPSAEASAEPAKPRGKPFELYNSCADVVTVVIGKDPKAADAGQRTAAPSSSIDLPRDSAGNQIVWLFDKKGEPSTHVTVTRSMTRVEVGRSCSTLNAK